MLPKVTEINQTQPEVAELDDNQKLPKVTEFKDNSSSVTNSLPPPPLQLPRQPRLHHLRTREAGRYGIADSNYYSELVLKGLITVTPACLPYILYISYCIVH